MSDVSPRNDPRARTRRGPVLAALVLAMFMAAIEGTIVATAMPDIAASLGGFALYSWVFASYLLMQAVTTPLFGKIADLHGRKPVFVGGVLLFLVASILCGFATTMPWLVASRFLQGIGAGAVQPATTTLAGDLYAFHERARVQGWLASVWGLSAVVGPLAGGLIVERVHWAWIFWINVPFGLVAILGVTLFLHEGVARRRRVVDRGGVALFLAGVGSLIVLLTQAPTLPWTVRLVLATTSLAALVLFWCHERRAPEPMMPPTLWRDRLVVTANLATLGAGVVMIAVITYLPTYAQGVMGTSALVAGFTLTTMSLGWPIASVVAGRTMVRRGTRTTARVGGVALFVGAAAFLALEWIRQPWYAAACSLLVGIGMGFLVTTCTVSVQTRVDWARRGAATASNMLMRILGNALGAALLGGVVNASLLAFLHRAGLADRVSLDAVTRLLGEAGGPGADLELAASISDGLADALHLAFRVVAGVALATMLVAFAIPELDRDERR